MGFTNKKYDVSLNFCHKVAFLSKIEGWHLWILSWNLKNLKTHTKFLLILLYTVIFWSNQSLTPIFWDEFWFFLIHKNLFRGPLCIINPKSGPHDFEIRNFGQFLSQTGVFQQNWTLHRWIMSQNLNFFKPVKNYIHDHYV
jgi:hypothetical protein